MAHTGHSSSFQMPLGESISPISPEGNPLPRGLHVFSVMPGWGMKKAPVKGHQDLPQDKGFLHFHIEPLPTFLDSSPLYP